MKLARMTLILSTLLLFSCAKRGVDAESVHGTAYAKSDLSSLQSCQFHADCASATEECVALGSTGTNRRCFVVGQAGDYVGCTKGQLILLSGDPEQFACL